MSEIAVQKKMLLLPLSRAGKSRLKFKLDWSSEEIVACYLPYTHRPWDLTPDWTASRLYCVLKAQFGQILKAMINNHSMHCLVVAPLLNASRGNTAFLLSQPGSPSVARENQTELCWMGLNKSMVLLTLDEGMKWNPSRQFIFIHFYLSSSFQTITWYNFIRPSLRSPDQFTN